MPSSRGETPTTPPATVATAYTCAGRSAWGTRAPWVGWTGSPRSLRRKTIRVKSTGETFETFVPTTDDDPAGKRYIIDVKSITARDRLVIDEDPATGEILRAEVRDSSFKKLVQPKDEHLGQTMLYAYLVTQPEFAHERLGGKPLATPPDVMVLYWGKDVDPRYYSREPETYPDPKGLLNAPFKVFTVRYDQRRVDALLRKADAIWAALDAGELPGRDHKHIPSRPAWACVDCAFRNTFYAKEGYFSNDPTEEPARVHYRRRVLEQRHARPEAEEGAPGSAAVQPNWPLLAAARLSAAANRGHGRDPAARSGRFGGDEPSDPPTVP